MVKEAVSMSNIEQNNALDNKENETIMREQPILENKNGREAQGKLHLGDMSIGLAKQLSQASVIKPERFVPTTPAAKLCMKDLTGMADLQVLTKEESPVETLAWNSSAQKNIRKRPRSSSPVGRTTFTSSPLGRGFDLKNLSQTLETPPKEPESTSFTPNIVSQRDRSLKRPRISFAGLMESSSPRKSRGTPRPLVRVGSFPTNLPSRFPTKVVTTGKHDMSETPTARARPFLGMLGHGIGTVDSAYPVDHSRMKNESSCKNVVEDNLSLQLLPEPYDTGISRMNGSTLDDLFTSDIGQGSSRKAEYSSSEYGDDFAGMDSEDLDKLAGEPKTVSPRPSIMSRSIANPNIKHAAPIIPNPKSREYTKSNIEAQAASHITIALPQHLGVTEGIDDEYGDIFDDAMLEIAEQYDNIPETKAHIAANNIKKVGADGLRSDDDTDEYDDGFDDDDFELAAAATQSLEQSIGSMPYVRTLFS
jgi:hypothetical protein